MKNTVKSGIYTFDFEKVGDVVSVAVKTTGGTVANGKGNSTKAAAENAAETSDDEGLKLTVNQTVFPEF